MLGTCTVWCADFEYSSESYNKCFRSNISEAGRRYTVISLYLHDRQRFSVLKQMEKNEEEDTGNNF